MGALKWKANKEKTEWTSGDYTISQATGAERKNIFHCRLKGSYFAQGSSLDDAKDRCQIDSEADQEKMDSEADQD